MASKGVPCLKINNDEVYVQMKDVKIVFGFEVYVFFFGFEKFCGFCVVFSEL